MQSLAVFSTLAIYLLVTPHFVNPSPVPVAQKPITTPKAEILEDKKALGKAEAPDPKSVQGDPLSKPGANDALGNDAASIGAVAKPESGPKVLNESENKEPTPDEDDGKNNVPNPQSTEKSAGAADEQDDPPSKPGANDTLGNDAASIGAVAKAESGPKVLNESETKEPTLDGDGGKNIVADAQSTNKSAETDKTQEPTLKTGDGESDIANPKSTDELVTTEKNGELTENIDVKIENDDAKNTEEPEKSITKTEATKKETPGQGNEVDANPQPDDTEKTDEHNSDDKVIKTGVAENQNEKPPSDDKENENEIVEKTSTKTTDNSIDDSKTVNSSNAAEAPKTSSLPSKEEGIIDVDQPNDAETEEDKNTSNEDSQDTEMPAHETEEETGGEAGKTEEGGESPGDGGIPISPAEEENPFDAYPGDDDSSPKENFAGTGGKMDLPITDNNEDDAPDDELEDPPKDGMDSGAVAPKFPVEPEIGNSEIYNDNFMDGEEHSKGHFFAFILTAMFFTAAVYLLYHNKRKVVALVLPGAQRRTGMRHRAGYKANYDRLENKPDWR